MKLMVSLPFHVASIFGGGAGGGWRGGLVRNYDMMKFVEIKDI